MEHVRNSNYKQLNLHASKNLHFEFKDLVIVLPSTVSKTFIATNVHLPLSLALILSISIVPLSTNLNKLNALSICHKVIPIDIAFRLLNEVRSSE